MKLFSKKGWRTAWPAIKPIVLTQGSAIALLAIHTAFPNLCNSIYDRLTAPCSAQVQAYVVPEMKPQVKVYENRTEISRRQLSGGTLLIDDGNDGSLDRKIVYFAPARAGIGGGVAKMEVTEEDQRWYNGWYKINDSTFRIPISFI